MSPPPHAPPRSGPPAPHRTGRGTLLAGRGYAALERFTAVLLLNLLWALCCLPVLTAGPATAALFGTVRDWERGNEPPLLRRFLTLFRENLRQALAVQALGAAALLGAAAALRTADALPSGARTAVLALLTVGALLTAAAAVHVLPLMTGYRMPLGRLLRVAALLAAGRPGATLRCLALLAAVGAATWVFPVLPVLAAAPVAACVQRWSGRAAEAVRAG